MKRKIVWLVVSCLMVLSLALAPCVPAVTEEEEVVTEEEVVPAEKEMVKWTGKKLDGTVVEKMLEKPRYGGIHVTARLDPPVFFDDVNPSYGGRNWVYNNTHDTLNVRCWTRGSVGTNEWTVQKSEYPNFEVEVGMVAESWELLPDDTLVYHIRQGIHWQDKPPLNGRELTADDVVFTLRRMWDVGYQQRNYRYLLYGMDREGIEKSIYVSPTDKWAVVIKNQPGTSGVQTLGISTVLAKVMAPETVGPDIAKSITDWKMVVGTGPFTLEDYVEGSVLTYVRNPNYWRNHPFFPEDQMPYVDTFKVLIIPDLSTRMAALRAGKIDNLTGVADEDAEQLLQSNPELESVSYLGSGVGIHMRVDNPELPFYDVRVRQALKMAINWQELRDDYYEGKAVIFHSPLAPIPEYQAYYRPLEEMPESVQELFGHHPDKARQLLAEAGYPEGFKTVILATAPDDIDILQIIKEYWSEIGVDLEIDVKEHTVFESMKGQKTHTEMMVGIGTCGLAIICDLRYKGWQNLSMANDEYINKLYAEVNLNYSQAGLGKLWTTPSETLPDMVTYVNEQSYVITMPAINSYVLWQPWLKCYGGAINAHYWGDPSWAPYVWIDQELKEAMGR